MKENLKRITLNLEEDIIKIAKEKAQLLFKGDLEGFKNYIHRSCTMNECKQSQRDECS